jgi:hypothetical protein
LWYPERLAISMVAVVALPSAVVGATSAPACDYWWQAREWYFGCFADDCFTRSGFADELHALRAASLACSQRSYELAGIHSHPETGTADNTWTEYNPTCSVIEYAGDNHLFTLAEPRNAISSLRGFDPVICVEGAEFAHQAAAYLGWGSFAYHGTGGPEAWSGAFDNHGMQCIALHLIHQVKTAHPSLGSVADDFEMPLPPALVLQMFSATRTPYVVSVLGSPFDFRNSTASCLPSAKEAIRGCTEDADSEMIDNLNANAQVLRGSNPSYENLFIMAFAGPLNMCEAGAFQLRGV